MEDDTPVLTTPCILTTYAIDAKGYGRISFRIKHDYIKHYRHHRFVYVQYHKLTFADIEGKVIRHLCNNPSCVNPEHLVLGTHKDNTQDMIKAGRHKWRRKLTPELVQQIRNSRDSYKELITKYSLSCATIYNIIHKRGAYKD